MNLWHLTTDTPRIPARIRPGVRVSLQVGTWPIESGQLVWADWHLRNTAGMVASGRTEAVWERNQGNNSYWTAELGPFELGSHVTYAIRGESGAGAIDGPSGEFDVVPPLHLAVLWHQHQPIYRDTCHPGQRGSYLHPWVRLHAVRDYYSMASLVAEHPGVHLTINLTPSLLWQIDDYVERGATDRALELTLTHPEQISAAQHEEILSTFFDADWHNQIFPHPRYRQLFELRSLRRAFGPQDVCDLQMWFGLAWFGQEFRDGEVELITGERVSVRGYVERGRDFDHRDVRAMVDLQYRILRAIVPIHRHLQDRGQIEVSTTPFYHPILPLLIDTDRAIIDRPGATHPRRFAFPEDASAQVASAVDFHERRFGKPPEGIWPAEGAVSQFALPTFAAQGIRWLATDEGVLARSGRWGYRTDDPDVLCQPYRAEEGDHRIAIFFRDSRLSDQIGFHYHRYADSESAAAEFLREVKDRFAWKLGGAEQRVLTLVLDGENAWGAYREDGRPFLRALYQVLERDPDIRTVTFGEFLRGNEERGVEAHRIDELPPVYDLFNGSWIDENGSSPGVDLGTWIGEPEENRAWDLLRHARLEVATSRATREERAAALATLYIAEGSDWFWWFGEDQDSGNDAEFDDLFRLHLRNAYRSLGVESPDGLDRHIAPHAVIWTFAHPVDTIQTRDRVSIRTNCPGDLTWAVDGGEHRTVALAPVGGVMAGQRRFDATLGPFPSGAQKLRFRFVCTHDDCSRRHLCCRGDDQVVHLEGQVS